MGKMFAAAFNDGEENIFDELISFIEKRGYNIFKLSNVFPINYLKYDSLSINVKYRTVEVDGKNADLTNYEFEILYLLAQNPGQVFSKEQIYSQVWQEPYFGAEDNVMSLIRRIRKKIEPNPAKPIYILTVWGIGYKFNRAALAEYVVHRRIILDLFSKGISIRDDGKFNLEEYMHNLIYPMRTTSDQIPYENHNLWLIDERLSFCQFISSDKPFDNKFGEERTDILVLDSPVAIAEGKNSGVAYDTVIIFELKRPMRDDYNMERNPITQLIDYAQKIMDGEVKDCNHRKITVTNSTQFYLYAVCDIMPSLERVLDRMSFTRTPDRLGAYFYNGTMHIYIEVLSYDKVRNDSEKRNKVLFDKLGIQSNI